MDGLKTIRMEVDGGNRPYNLAYELQGNTLTGIIMARTLTKDAAGKDEFKFVESSRTVIGPVSSVEELDSLILGHFRWANEKIRKECVKKEFAAIQASIVSGLAQTQKDEAVKAAEIAAKAAADAQVAPPVDGAVVPVAVDAGPVAVEGEVDSTLE